MNVNTTGATTGAMCIYVVNCIHNTPTRTNQTQMREGQHLAYEFIHNTPTRTTQSQKRGFTPTRNSNAGLSHAGGESRNSQNRRVRLCIHRRKSLGPHSTLCFSFTYCSVRLLAVLSSTLSLSFSSLPGGRICLPSFLGDGTCQIEFVH